MLLKLYRFYENEDSTAGRLEIDNEHFCFTIEDEHRDSKVQGETRIPMGRYRILFRKVLSPMTEDYRDKFPWFSWHLELQDVPNFEYVYIHIGNNERNTDACILVNYGCLAIPGSNASGQMSTQAYERLYKKVSALLEDNVPVYIEIHNK